MAVLSCTKTGHGSLWVLKIAEIGGSLVPMLFKNYQELMGL
jgi:hypothetical protein